jgi:SAM-dependent methyltransferase
VGKVAKVYRSILALPELVRTVNRIERELTTARMGPIDRHVLLNAVGSRAGLFHESYDDWRVVRINKILELYGVDFFPGKRILELGAGHGDIGAFFAELGAQVVCLDGRIQNVNLARLKHRDVPGIEFRRQDLETDFTGAGRFDLVIDMGLLYHVPNVAEHLGWALSMADEIVLETSVCDSTDPHLVLLEAEDSRVDEEALGGTGSRPSPFFVERLARESGFEIVRCFTADLNAGPQFRYDWAHRNDGGSPKDMSLRRFWRFMRPSAPA